MVAADIRHLGGAYAEDAADPGRLFPSEVRRRLASVKRRYDPGNTLLASFSY